MNSAEFEQLLEIAKRRKLSPEEQARLETRLADDPAARSIWEEEIGLTRLLGDLPDAPLASNFTAQILRAVGNQTPGRRRAPEFFRWLGLQRPAFRAAWGCILAVLIGLGYHAYQVMTSADMALSVATVGASVNQAARAVDIPSVEVWQDFEPIYRLDHSQPQADLELLAALR